MPAVLITGTSTGFGRVTTEILAAKGWRVFATMRDLAKKGPLERALKKAGLESQVTILQLDVNDPASIEAAVAAILAETGNALDAVVHNAGVAVAGAHEDIPDAEIRRVMETNFFGVLALTRAAAADLPRAAARPHRPDLEPGGIRRSAGKLDLLRLEMGARGLGRGDRL